MSLYTNASVQHKSSLFHVKLRFKTHRQSSPYGLALRICRLLKTAALLSCRLSLNFFYKRMRIVNNDSENKKERECKCELKII